MGESSLIGSMVSSFKANKARYTFFILAVVSAFACFISSSLYYSNKKYDNPIDWLGWVLGMIFLFLTFFPTCGEIKKKFLSAKSSGILILLGFVALLFFISHLWNFKTAPWNYNGLFDDAAWDLHFVKTYILAGKPFQAAVFLDGYSASRETLYHLYLVPFLELFGFNILSYDIALLVLGFITVLFTTLLIHRLFKNYIVTVTSAILLNFLPLHYIHTFVGHRYALMAPMMMISMYFLYTGFKDKSYFRISVSSIFGGLCFASSIIGKQYLMGLFGAVVLYLVLNFKKSFTREKWDFAKMFVGGLIISSVPLIVYILFNQGNYFSNESTYTKIFFDAIHKDGMKGFMTFFTRMTDCLFGQTWDKWFLPDFPLLPVPYYVFFVPGIAIAFWKKHYTYIVLALLPPLGAFIAGFSDYRVLHSSPYWIILMAFTINEIIGLGSYFKEQSGADGVNFYRLISEILMLAVLCTGLVPCIKYIDLKSKDPYSVWYFAQKDVAVSRYLRDIVGGAPNPSPDFSRQEFNKVEGVKEPNYDTLICQNLGYAITHLFLNEYDSYKVLSMSNGVPYTLLSENEILDDNKTAIENYTKSTKDLKLVWEITDKTNRIIGEFKKLNYLGTEQVLTSQHAGEKFSFYVLTIKNENIDEFKQKVIGIRF